MKDRRNSVTILSKDIRWVVALKAEAKPIIESLNLCRINDGSIYPIYKDKRDKNWLVISGVGQQKAAHAATYLYKRSGAKDWSVWVNVGIAGSSFRNYGQLFLIDKITQANSNKCFYPSSVVKTNLEKGELLTVDEPLVDYSKIDLVDMEAAEFMRVASKMSPRDLILVFKVVSDGPKNSIERLNARRISDLISQNISHVIGHLMKVASLASIEKKRLKDPRVYQDVIGKWHFTVSQAYELKTLIRRWLVVAPNADVMDRLGKFKNSRQVLKYLKEHLNNFEIDWK
mgnify:FL=1